MVLLHNVFVYMYDLIWRLAREHLMVAGHGQGAGPGGLQEAAGGITTCSALTTCQQHC